MTEPFNFPRDKKVVEEVFRKNTAIPLRNPLERDYTYYWQLWHHNWDDSDIDLLVQKCALKGKKVLEVGCGDGRITLPLSLVCGSITGVDLRDDLISIAKESVKSKGLYNAEFLKMDATRLHFDDETFDVVLFPWVLQMVDDPLRAVTEAFRVLKKSGQVAIIGLLSDADYDRIIAKFLPDPLQVGRIDPRLAYEEPLRQVFSVDPEAVRSVRTFNYYFETLDLAHEAFLFALDRWYGGIKLSSEAQHRLREELEKYLVGSRVCIAFPAFVYFATKWS